MIDSGEARFALVQSDVAAAAVTGQAAFATYGPLRHLRAVAALFPEPVHVVVREADAMRSIGELRDKRVEWAVVVPARARPQCRCCVRMASSMAIT